MRNHCSRSLMNIRHWISKNAGGGTNLPAWEGLYMRNKLMSIGGICILPVLTFGIFWILAEGFGLHTINIILSQSMIPITLGLAMACIMPAGLMDFSPGARVLLGAVIGGLCAQRMGLAGMIIGCFVGAMLGGMVIALLYRYLKIPSMVVSFGVVLILEAVTDRIAKGIGGASTVKVSSELASFASYPNNLIITLLACLFFSIFIIKPSWAACLERREMMRRCSRGWA